MLDRIDIQIEIVPVPFEEIPRAPEKAGCRIRERNPCPTDTKPNVLQTNWESTATPKWHPKFAQPDAAAGLELLRNAMNRLNLSARAYELKVSRTIADLEGSNEIRPEHLAEAISYRVIWIEKNWAG